MDTLLDFYRLRFGQAVKKQGNGWNGPCPICGGEPGRSDRFMVWPERDDHLGEVCAENRILGIWSCRKCGASGDTISYLVKCEGMDFRAALGELGIEGGCKVHRRRRAPIEPKQDKFSWTPQEIALPSPIWQKAAMKLVETGERHLPDNQPAIKWLASRGLDETAIAKYRIGWLPPESDKAQGRFRPRSSFGLAPKEDKEGKTRTRLFIPRGIVIPSFDPAGHLLNIRIRRHREDLREGFPKYQELEGSARGPLVLEGSTPAHLAAWVIVEAELDAMLIHHATGGKVGAIAVRTNRGKPDSATHSKLMQAARILIALDFDEAGTAGVDFWEDAYQRAMRWPTPDGKDPGEAFALGVDIREWISAALPACISLESESQEPHGSSISQESVDMQDFQENGHLDPSLPGQQNLGGGEEKSEPVKVEKAESDAGQEAYEREYEPFMSERCDFNWCDLNVLEHALSLAGLRLQDVPLDVARVWLVWRQQDANVWDKKAGRLISTGAPYVCPWQISRALSEAFWNYPGIYGWINKHPADVITADNLFKIEGK